MTDFEILPHEIPGIKRAAQWHWDKFQELKALSEEMRQRGMPYGALMLQAESHRHNAGVLNFAWKTRSSVTEGGSGGVSPFDHSPLDAGDSE